ncbi:MAG: hypothetical protein AB4372_23220 [Xenococcus sp. (in: cyanobacteria)]
MLSYEECLDYLKLLTKLSNYENKTYCQKLDIISRKFGFNNYYEFKNTLEKLPSERFFKVSSELIKEYCLIATPDPNNQYYFFTALNSKEFSYYSYWIGFDKFGEEVRVPRLINPEQVINIFRDSSNSPSPIYIIENNKQLLCWWSNWYGKALITKELAEAVFPSFFNKEWRICKNVDTELIKKRNNILQRLEKALTCL